MKIENARETYPIAEEEEEEEADILVAKYDEEVSEVMNESARVLTTLIDFG